VSGKAYLVGAGPGRPDLITVRGLRVLRRAEVVMYDRLVAKALVDEAPTAAERIDVGKAPGRHALPQDRINQILVERVRAGRRVVRLKGGDPFVLGRGGEEALALAGAGLPFEVVPGVSSAVAVPAYAGVPVTHRGVAHAFAVVTGHRSNGQEGPDWEAVARVPTLVVLMGMGRLPRICEELLRAGRAPDTPAMAVQHGTAERQRVVRATLATLPIRAQELGLGAPATVVVGEVVGLAQDLAWFRPGARRDETAAEQTEEAPGHAPSLPWRKAVPD